MATVLTGERRIVSVLIADVVNSTGIAERLGPERSKFLMDEVLRIMTEQVERYDGTVVRRAGWTGGSTSSSWASRISRANPRQSRRTASAAFGSRSEARPRARSSAAT